MNKKKENKTEKEIKIETENADQTSIDAEKDQVDEEQESEIQPQTEIEAAKAQIEELKDKYLRQVAEFDNYRKRTIKEKADLILNGGEKILISLLPILDDFERAIKNMNDDSNVETIKEGVLLIQQKLMKTLISDGLTVIETKDAMFDTDYHEAIAMVPVEDAEQKGKILDCVQAGYKLHDKVIRHAKVAVGQ